MAKGNRGGKVSSSGKVGSEVEKTEKQIPTKAKFIDKMNEAQLDIEIAKQQRIINAANKTMGNVPTVENIGAIPLGQLTRGKTKAQKDKIIERGLNQAVKYKEAYDKREAAQDKLDALQKAKKEISGTGKTLREIRESKKQKIVSETKSTLKWKQTQKASMNNGAYFPKVISAGNFKISGSSGMYTIYHNGKEYGTVSSLSTAKAIAERLNKKSKK